MTGILVAEGLSSAWFETGNSKFMRNALLCTLLSSQESFSAKHLIAETNLVYL